MRGDGDGDGDEAGGGDLGLSTYVPVMANMLLLYRTRIEMNMAQRLLNLHCLRLYTYVHTHHPVDPPSTRKSVPVTYELASASRNTTAPRYSSGPEILLSIASCFHTVVHSLLVRTCLVIGVWMTPGLMEFTRMAGDDGDDGDDDEEEEESLLASYPASIPATIL